MNLEEFLNTSYTAYHAVENCRTILENNGFTRLDELQSWQIAPGGKYYCVKNGSAIIAFVVGDLTSYAFNVAESHTDSPALKVKGNLLIDSPEGKRLNVEKYGGGLLYSMLDIPLKVCGRLFTSQNGKIVPALVTSKYNVNVPSLAIHHNIEANDKLSLNVQTDMLPLIGEAKDVYSTLTDKTVIDADLYVVPDVACLRNGVNGEFLTSPRIDNLTSVYASINALTDCKPKGVAVACCFDNEEVGSHTQQGAYSAFLPDLLKRVNRALGFNEEDYAKAIANGFALSIDNGHAVHPAHPEKSDPCQKVYLNKGIVIKHHVNYATDGFSSAVVKLIMQKNGIAWQDYYNRSDLRCGSTLGLVTGAQLQINVCDIGLAQLAMHSAIETVGAYDVELMQKFVNVFYNCSINTASDGKTEIF